MTFPHVFPAVMAVVFSGSILCRADAVGAAPPGGGTAPVSAAAPATVDLAQAIRMALDAHPRLRSAEAASRAAAGRLQQSAARPNPEIEAEVEDVGLRGDGFQSSTVTLRAGQVVELGGKRAARKQVAGLDLDLARRDADSARVELVAEVKDRFREVLVARERARAAGLSRDLAATVRDTVAERVRSGKVSPVALIKADVELAGRRVEVQRAETSLSAASAALRALWGEPPAGGGAIEVLGDLREIPAVPDLEALMALLPRHPAWARGEREEDLARAQVAVERAAAVPDVTLSAGLAHGREDRAEAVELAVSFPLPLFDRNRGAIAAAMAEVDRVRADQAATRLALRSDLVSQWHEYQAATAEARAVRDDILPGARKAFDTAAEAYRSGRLEYLDVLDAQQTLADAERHGIEALDAVHRSIGALERLVGGSLVQD